MGPWQLLSRKENWSAGGGVNKVQIIKVRPAKGASGNAFPRGLAIILCASVPYTYTQCAAAADVA